MLLQEARPQLRPDQQFTGAGSHLTATVTAGVAVVRGGLIFLIELSCRQMIMLIKKGQIVPESSPTPDARTPGTCLLTA